MAKIELPVERDFGQLIGDPILFMRQNIKHLSRSFLYFIVPMLLVATVLTGFGLKDVFADAFTRRIGSGHVAAAPNLAWVGIAYLLFIIIYLFQHAYIAQYMVLYDQNEQTTIRDVWDTMLKDWKLIVPTYLVFIPITLLSFGVSAGLIYLSAAVGKGLAGFLMLIIYLVFIYTTIPLAHLIMVRMRERISIAASIAKCFKITAGKWWRTFGGFIMLTGVMYSLMILALIPFYMVIFFVAFNRLNAGSSLGSSVPTALTGIYVTAVVFWMFFLFQMFYVYIGINYFSLSEGYDNFDLRKQIENIGEQAETHTDKQEGEY